MGFFTRNPRDDSNQAAGAAGASRGEAGNGLNRRRGGPAAQRDHAADDLRRRARRRLVGAIAMVLAAVIVLPMILDAPPDTPSSGSAEIQIPSQDQPFEPRFADNATESRLPQGTADTDMVGAAERLAESAELPAAPGEAAAEAPDSRLPASIATITPVPGNEGAGDEPADTSAPSRTPEPEPEPPQAQQPAAPAAASPDREAQRALALLEGRAVPESPSASTSEGRYAVQVVAVRSRGGAEELIARLRDGGLTAYIETIQTPEGEVHRVRLGPYASRGQAESAQSRLQSMPGGFQGNLVPL